MTNILLWIYNFTYPTWRHFKNRTHSRPVFRVDPIPYTHKRVKFRRFRRIRTMQEHRLNRSDIYKDFVRGKRRGANLPTYYDDIHRSDINKKSWKRKKIEKQWMKNLK